MKLFGETLKELRLQHHLPLRKVAAYLDLDTSILSKIERGERLPQKEIVSRAAEFFALDESELMSNFLGERVARTIYMEDNCSDILEAAKNNIDYLKSKFSQQGYFEFDNE